MTPISSNSGKSRNLRSGRTIRIAYVIPGLHYGGMERLLHDLAHALPAHAFEVHIVVVEGFGRFAEGLTGVAELHQVPVMNRLSLIYPKELIAVLRRLAPDIVHSHAGVWHKASRAARLAGIPIVIHTEHGRRVPDRVTDRLIDNLASRSTDAIIAVSEALATVLTTRVVHDPRRILVIVNGVDVKRLRPPSEAHALRRELGLPDGSFIIGSIGRLEPVKNYSLALRAFARLVGEAGEGRPPFLVLAGDGSERGPLETLARSLGIAAQVKFLGFRDDVERLYGAFDLFTLTSTNEGTSVSLLEAMSCGRCPVVTDVGGNRAVLGPNLSSLLVPAEDEAGLAAAWNRHVVDAQLRQRLGAFARERVVAAFSLDHMVHQHVALYRRLSDAARSAACAGP